MAGSSLATLGVMRMPTLMLPTLAMLPSNSHPQLSSQDLLARWVPCTCAATPYGIPGLKLLNSQAHGRCPGVVSRDQVV